MLKLKFASVFTGANFLIYKYYFNVNIVQELH